MCSHYYLLVNLSDGDDISDCMNRKLNDEYRKSVMEVSIEKTDYLIIDIEDKKL